jgi:small subunit ribosomal protein S4
MSRRFRITVVGHVNRDEFKKISNYFMAKYNEAKCKLCRRSGEKLFLKGDRCDGQKCAMIRKNYAPGAHGKKKSRGLSEFGKQLAMKQKIKRTYGVLERQFRKHFEEIRNKAGVTGDNLMARLEMRLDNVVYRTGFAASRSLARQLVTHGAFLLNGKKTNIPSVFVKVNDVIKVKESKLKDKYFSNQSQYLKNKKGIPSWILFDFDKMEAKIVSVPKRDNIEGNVNSQLVVEYYSR